MLIYDAQNIITQLNSVEGVGVGGALPIRKCPYLSPCGEKRRMKKSAALGLRTVAEPT